MKVELMCNGWIPPVNVHAQLGEPRNQVNVNTRLEATIEGTPEQIAAIQTGLQRGWKPEFWVVSEVIE